MAVNPANAMPSDQQADRRRRAKRAAVLLGLVAAAFYFGFIVLMYLRGQH
jgi:hypothetical protein